MFFVFLLFFLVLVLDLDFCFIGSASVAALTLVGDPAPMCLERTALFTERKHMFFHTPTLKPTAKLLYVVSYNKPDRYMNNKNLLLILRSCVYNQFVSTTKSIEK